MLCKEMIGYEHLTQEQKMLKCFLCGSQFDWTLWKHGHVEDRESYKDQSVKSMIPACEKCYQTHRAIMGLEW